MNYGREGEEKKEEANAAQKLAGKQGPSCDSSSPVETCRKGMQHQLEPGSLLPPPPIQAPGSHCSTATREIPAGPPYRSAGARFLPSRRPWALHGPPLPSGLRGRSSGRGSELVPAQDPDWPAAGRDWRAAALKLAARSSNQACIRKYKLRMSP